APILNTYRPWASGWKEDQSVKVTRVPSGDHAGSTSLRFSGGRQPPLAGAVRANGEQVLFWSPEVAHAPREDDPLPVGRPRRLELVRDRMRHLPEVRRTRCEDVDVPRRTLRGVSDPLKREDEGPSVQEGRKSVARPTPAHVHSRRRLAARRNGENGCKA